MTAMRLPTKDHAPMLTEPPPAEGGDRPSHFEDPACPTTATNSRRRYEWVRLIGWCKIVQGGLLFVLAAGILRFLNRSIDMELAQELVRLHVDLDSPWVQRLLDRLGQVDRHQMMTLSTGGFVYSLLLLIEGTGLCLQKRWGDYFTILVTGSFLPFELYECIQRFSIVPLGVLLLNAAVLAYLVVRVRREHQCSSAPKGESCEDELPGLSAGGKTP